MLDVDAGARRVRNRERIDQVSVTVKQRVEGHVMEQLVGNYDQALSLYTELLAPIRSRLKRQRLIVVPPALLHYVPFPALFDAAPYLNDSFAVSYPSSAALAIHTRL